MRTTTLSGRSARLTLPLVALLVLFGCDGTLLASQTAEIKTETKRGDVLYSLAPLDTGDTFAATLRLDDGTDIVLYTEGIGDGLAETRLDTGSLPVTSITVEYLSDGIPTAPARSIDPAGFFSFDSSGDEGDTSGESPTSYHYVERDGQIVIEQDYTASIGPETTTEKQYLGTRGATFVMDDGSRVPVTHLRYTIHTDGDVPSPAAVMFDSSVDLYLLESNIQ